MYILRWSQENWTNYQKIRRLFMSMLVVVIIGKISQMNSGKFPVLEMNHFVKNPDKI